MITRDAFASCCSVDKSSIPRAETVQYCSFWWVAARPVPWQHGKISSVDLRPVVKQLLRGDRPRTVLLNVPGGGRALEYRKLIQHRFHLGALLPNIFVVQAFDPAVRRATNARESVARLVTACKGRVVFLYKIAKICAEIHEAVVRQQLNRMPCLVHHEWRLKCEESKCRIVEVVRLVNRQCFQQCTVPRRQPAEFM